MSGVINLGAVPHANLTKAIDAGAEHMRPIYRAIRDHGCTHMLIAQHAGPFDLPPSHRPMISIVGDDLDHALGPRAFPRKSIRRLLRDADAAVIVSSAPTVPVYGAAAIRAVERQQNIVIVETRPEHEMQWLDFIMRLRGDCFPILISTVKPSDMPASEQGAVH